MKAPVEMPTMYVAQQIFEVQRNNFTAPTADARVGGVQAGFPLWGGSWTLSRMPVENSDEWRAFIADQRGGIRRFLARDLARQYPREYPDGFGAFGAFTGAASGWSQTINSDEDAILTLTLGSAAAGLILSPGDYVDFRYTTTEPALPGIAWRTMSRVTVGGTANGSGVVTVTIDPPVPTNAVPNTAVAHLDEPACVMTVIADRTSLDRVDRLYSVQGGTLVGVQDIRS